MEEKEFDSNRQIAKEQAERWFSRFQYAQERQNLVADSFRRLQIQIASILFGFTTAFLSGSLKSEPWSVKVLFISALASLALSLLCGLINEHSLYSFWDSVSDKTQSVTKRYEQARRDGEVGQADEYQKGAVLQKLRDDSTKIWWVLQSILLTIGFVLIFGVFIQMLTL